MLFCQALVLGWPGTSLLGLDPGILHGFNGRFQGFHLLLGFLQFRSIFLRRHYQGVKVSAGIGRHLWNLD